MERRSLGAAFSYRDCVRREDCVTQRPATGHRLWPGTDHPPVTFLTGSLAARHSTMMLAMMRELTAGDDGGHFDG
jgi:hypothetical protein